MPKTLTNVTLRLEDTVKSKAESVFSSLGITMDTALSAFLMVVAHDKKIPEEIAPFARQEFFDPKAALEELSRYAGKIDRDIDVKAELAEWRDSRYADTD